MCLFLELARKMWEQPEKSGNMTVMGLCIAINVIEREIKRKENCVP